MKKLDENCIYTLENVQVDCRDLEQKEISLIGNIYKSKGYTLSDRYNKITNDDYYISLNKGISSYGFYEIDDDCTTITYEKFMELFAEPQYEVKYIAEEAKETFNPQPHYNNDKGSLYKVAQDRNWNAYLFDIVKRLERGGKKDPLEQEIKKSIDLLNLWLIEHGQSSN